MKSHAALRCLTAACLVSWVACRAKAPGLGEGWEKTASDRLLTGDCRGALAILKRANRTADASWYDLKVAALTQCFANSSVKSYFVEGLETVKAGLVRFPRSARLRMDEGDLYAIANDGERERRAYEDAAKVARENIQRAGTDTGAIDDRIVLAQVEKRLGVLTAPVYLDGKARKR
jgi:hypothetical protein